MPNTLCHIGLQSPLNRLVSRDIDLRLVIIGCIVPDLPWILLTLLLPTQLVNPYDLRLYCTAQASLFFCLIFCFGAATLGRNFFLTAVILGVNCLFHLLLDALQIKWGNGINLFAPFDWKFMHFDLTWPEHRLTVLATCAGLVFLLTQWKKLVTRPVEFAPASAGRAAACIFFFSCYFFGPLLVIDDLEKADIYYLHTMRASQERQGKSIEFDRVRFDAETQKIKTFAGERITLRGEIPPSSGRTSLKGYFLTPTTVYVIQFHRHNDFRDAASYVGLFMACTLLAQSLILPLVSSSKIKKGQH